MQPRKRRSKTTRGRRYLTACFAFIARSAQTTNDHGHEIRKGIHHSQLPRDRSRRGPPALLPNRVPRRADRSRLRGPRIIRGFPDQLLHGQGTGIVLRARDRRRNPRLPAWLAQAALEPALFLSPKHPALSPRALALPALRCAVAPI